MNMSFPDRQLEKRMMGVTLLELILVMVLLCTVLAIAAPSLRGFFANREINETSSRICSMMRYASTQAISGSNYYRFNYNTDTHKFWLTYLYEGRYEILETNYSKKFSIPLDIDVEIEDWPREEGAYYVEFSPIGKTTVGRMRLTNPQDRKIDILCLSSTELYQAIEYKKNDEEIVYDPIE